MEMLQVGVGGHTSTVGCGREDVGSRCKKFTRSEKIAGGIILFRTGGSSELKHVVSDIATQSL